MIHRTHKRPHGKIGADEKASSLGTATRGAPHRMPFTNRQLAQRSALQREAAPPRGTVPAERGPAGDSTSIRHHAEQGVAGSGGPLPFLDELHRSFGPDHDLSNVRAHVGGEAAAAATAIGAQAFTVGHDVAFREQPDLFLVAHEAAHVVQQRDGVQLAGGIGQEGDPYERHADAVAKRVVAGESAADLLPAAGGAGAGRAVQRKVGLEFETRWDLEANPNNTIFGKKLERNQTVLKGRGWTMVPDGSDGAFRAEFKTRPFDENESMESVHATMQDLETFCDGIVNLRGPTKLEDLPNATAEWATNNATLTPDGALSGVPQVTGGINVNAIIDLFERLAWNDRHSNRRDDEIDESNRSLSKILVNTAKPEYEALRKDFKKTTKNARGLQVNNAYAGFVTLVANYILGARAQAEQERQQIEDLQDLVEEELTPQGPGWAKDVAPVFSRTNLGALAAAIKIPSGQSLLDDVLHTAGLDESAADEQLFPHGLSGQREGRTIEQHPEITIGEWIAKIESGMDYEWNETKNSEGKSFGFEPVGPKSNPTIGPILELRTLDMTPYELWRPLAYDLVTLFKMFNARYS